MHFFLTSLYSIGLYSAYAAGAVLLHSRSAQSGPDSNASPRPFPTVTLLLMLLVAGPTTLQFFWPVILELLQRDATRFGNGEWWRLLTPLFVQDGGIPGSLFNLVSLFLVGSVTEQLWGKRNLIILFFASGIIGEIAGFAWQPIGAGNSVANFGLAASIALACLTRPSSRFVRITSCLALGADVVLVALRDLHGAAALAGAMLAFVFSQTWDRRNQ